MRFNKAGASAFPAGGKRKFVMPKGDYAFEVVHAAEGLSKEKFDASGVKTGGGVPMITLTVKIDNGMASKEIKDYLVSTVPWKIQQFAEATGLMDEFDAGSLDYVQCTGAKGMCRVEVESSEQYGDKNVIKAYLAKSVDRSIEVATQAAKEDDDLPW